MPSDTQDQKLRTVKAARRTSQTGARSRPDAPHDQMDKAITAWRVDLETLTAAAAAALDEWIEHTNLSQNGFARTVDQYLPPEVGSRGVTGPTVSRYRNMPGQLMKASMAAWLTMLHVTGHSVLTAAQRMQDTLDMAHARAQAGRDPAQLQAVMQRQQERRRMCGRAAALLDTLTDRQVNDITLIMETYARQNLNLRAHLAQTEGTPYSTDVPGMEARAAGMAAQGELAEWVQEQRDRTDSSEEAK